MVRRPGRLLKVLRALFLIDVAIAAEFRAAGCRHCGGPLHAAHYARKPRGLPPGAQPELSKRHSFCCARAGCRRRATPPSTRFQARRVWLAPWVVWLGVWVELGASALDRLRRRAGLSRRTAGRWSIDWTSVFPGSPRGRELAARFLGAIRLRQIWKQLLPRGVEPSRWVGLLRILAGSHG